LHSEPEVPQSEGSAQSAAQTTDDSAAAEPTEDMISEFFKTFSDNVRLVRPSYLVTLCDLWKIECLEFLGTKLVIEDVEGCVENIVTVMVDRSMRGGWPPRYPVNIGFCIGAKTLPRSVEEFHEQEEQCKSCLVVRKKWDRPGRSVTNYFCNSHMFGACVVGVPFEYRQF
jgi:hypothetical protein